MINIDSAITILKKIGMTFEIEDRRQVGLQIADRDGFAKTYWNYMR